jgi:hypothetical protein
MTTLRFLALYWFLALIFIVTKPAFGQQEPLTCRQVFQEVWADHQTNKLQPQQFREEIGHNLSPATSPGCTAEYLHSLSPNLRKAALDLFKPTRRNIFQALQNYSPQQQQGSTTSSTSSVNPVSKVTGPSAISEEFSGVNVNSSTSALTFQFAPATLLTNLKKANVIVPCSSSLRIKDNCFGGFWDGLAEHLTFSVTTNTSTTGQAVKGTATSSGSGAPAVPATLSTAGSMQPSFGGFGTKFALYTAPDKKASAESQGKLDQATKEFDAKISQTSVLLENQLLNCPAFSVASDRAADAIAAQPDEETFYQTLSGEYGSLGESLLSCLLQPDSDLAKALQNYLAAVLADAANENEISAAGKPIVSFEYDLNTPQNQPSYSSIKSNFSLTFGSTDESKNAKSATKAKHAKRADSDTKGSCDTAKSNSTIRSACGTASIVIASLRKGPDMLDGISDSSASLSDTKAQNAVAKSAAGANTKPFAINASVGVDLYNAEPLSSIPSASHLRDFQAGAEIDWILRSSKIPAIGSLVGDSTLSGVYYYQDQTSPSILKGPPQTVTIADLPPTATQVYTSRGPINLGQIRLGLGTGSNVSFPICFTYSNRSGLIQHPIKGFQFGLSYNLSSLFSGKSQ